MTRHLNLLIIVTCVLLGLGFMSPHALAQDGLADVAAEGGSSTSYLTGIAVALLALAVALLAEALLVVLAKKDRFNIAFLAAGVSFLVLIGVGSLVYHTTGAIIRGPSHEPSQLVDQGTTDPTQIAEAELDPDSIWIDPQILAAGDAEAGGSIFQANCAVCHQTEGKGKAGLAPSIRNRDFLALASDELIYKTIRLGRKGTAMVGRPNLSDEDIAGIIAYLRSLPIANPFEVEVDPQRIVPGNATVGAELYANFCGSCHGEHGEGYAAGGSGPGIGLSGFLSVASDDYIFQTIKQGRIGTAMMPFLGAKGLANLSEQEAYDIIAHLRNEKRGMESAAAVAMAMSLPGGGLEAGEQLFAANCAVCHQTDGKGKAGLAPSIRNRDFLALASDEFVYQTIKQGRPGTAMVGRTDLSDEAIGSVIVYLRSLEVANPVEVHVDPMRTYEGDVAAGGKTYANFCGSCHGPNGEGYSAGGSGPGIGLPGFLDLASDDYIFQTIKQGRIGTAMMPFLGAKGLANLSEQEAYNVIAYLRDEERSKVAATAMASQSSGSGPGDFVNGKRLFAANCAVCHQEDGKGHAGLAPSIRNRDFLTLASDEFIAKTVTQGRPGTAMIGRVDLAGQSIKDITAYLRTLVIANPIDVTVNPDRKVTGDAVAGAQMYASYCASCHGSHGEGYSAGGSGPGIGLPGFLDVASDDYIFQTVKQGRIGTAMKPFLGSKGLANLMEQDVYDIIAHLRHSSASQSTESVVLKPSNAVTGKRLFAANCAVCHQEDGKGHPGLAPSIRNRDFLAIASDDFIQATVQHGRAGTMMVPRPDLGEQKVAHIIAYLRSLKVANPVDIQVDPNKTISGNIHSGIAKYAQFCASCHGPNGEGYSAGGSGPGIGLPGFLDVASDDYISQTIKHGRIGTAMMPFLGAKGLANLTEEDINDIIAWLRSHNP